MFTFQLNTKITVFALASPGGGGVGSEAWDRVSMIAPVKKFARVRLSTGFREQETWRTSVSGERL